MGWLHGVLLFVAAQRLAELWLARRNTRALLAEGAVEHGAGHYPLFVLLHAGWLLALLLTVPPERSPALPLLALYALLQFGRLWVILSLGRFWATRILTLPGRPLVRDGPYRYLRHPNYWVVTAEIALLPLAFDAWEVALLFSLLNAALLRHRIRIEDAALSERRVSERRAR